MDWNCIYDTRVQLGLLVVIGSTLIVYKAQKKKSKYVLPPGPTPWPLVGNLPSTGLNNLHLKFSDLKEKYGDIFTVYLGRQPTVILNSAKITREAFIQKANDFAGRPYLFSFNLFTDGGKDIAFGQFGPVWKLQRKIAHGAIRKYASGQHLEDLVNLAFQRIEKEMLKETGPFFPMDYNMLLIYNIIAGMCFGKMVDPDDPFVVEMRNAIVDLPKIIGDGLMADFVPLLQHKAFETRTIKRVKAVNQSTLDYLTKQFDDHLETFDPDNCTDLTYEVIRFWKQAQKEENDQTVLSQLDKSYFVQILSDAFFGGTDTSRCTLTYLIGHLVNHPECQQKLHDELDSVVGSEGFISLSTKEKLPYTQAVLFESMRLQPILPLALPHTTTCDTSLGDYTLPKGTGVMMNTWAINHDPEYFKDPWTYNPDRWLDEKGDFHYHAYNFVSFSMGRRVCVGESLAKAELPLLVAKMFQKFKFSSATGEKVEVKGIDSFGLLEPEPFQVTVQKRF